MGQIWTLTVTKSLHSSSAQAWVVSVAVATSLVVPTVPVLTPGPSLGLGPAQGPATSVAHPSGNLMTRMDTGPQGLGPVPGHGPAINVVRP